jgi:hypothetical protein
MTAAKRRPVIHTLPYEGDTRRGCHASIRPLHTPYWQPTMAIGRVLFLEYVVASHHNAGAPVSTKVIGE